MIYSDALFAKVNDLTSFEKVRVIGVLILLLGAVIYLGFWPSDWLQQIEFWINSHAVWPAWPILVYVFIAVVDTHITTVCVTLYLHRNQTHRSITFQPFIAELMQAWLWVRTAMPTKEWVAVHRKHHAFVESEDDPHTPWVYGIWRVLFYGTKLYHRAAHDQATLERFGTGTPSHWVARVIYGRFSLLGPVLTLVSNLWLFGVSGFPMWLFEMVWIPGFAAGVINGLGHWWGYRNFDTPDESRNLPGRIWALLTCGEALHNNHHDKQNSPRFARKPGEIDLGYIYFCKLENLGLAQRER